MESRKLEMMKLSYIFAGVVFVLYLAACVITNAAPDGMAVSVMFGAVGLGHGSANWANAKEHQSKN